MEVYETVRDKKKVRKISKEDMIEVEVEIKDLQKKMNEPDIWDEMGEFFVDGLGTGLNLAVKVVIFFIMSLMASAVLRVVFGTILSDIGLGSVGITVLSFITTIVFINTNWTLKRGFKYGFFR